MSVVDGGGGLDSGLAWSGFAEIEGNEGGVVLSPLFIAERPSGEIFYTD